MIYEPDVTLTDYFLTAECFFFVWRLGLRKSTSQVLKWWMLFYFAIGAASASGGTVHGFFPSGSGEWGVRLWHGALSLIGIASFAAWGIGARISFSERTGNRIVLFAGLMLVLYLLYILYVRPLFLAAMVFYFPAAAFLLICCLKQFASCRETRMLWGIAGLLLIFLGSLLQQAKVAVHPVYFTHNALYHAVEALALYLIYKSVPVFDRSPA